jgi:uncharacterized metal-binding protein YceD (DUF177 family)
MALSFNLRHLDKADLHLQGDLAADELELTGIDEMVALSEPVQYDLVLERLSDSVLVQGSLRCGLACQCVRCLRAFAQILDLPHWTCDLPLEGEERVLVNNDVIDLTPYVREDILLAFPQHPLCKPDCPGLIVPEANSKPMASVEDQAARSSSAWAELNKLKF